MPIHTPNSWFFFRLTCSFYFIVGNFLNMSPNIFVYSELTCPVYLSLFLLFLTLTLTPVHLLFPTDFLGCFIVRSSGIETGSSFSFFLFLFGTSHPALFQGMSKERPRNASAWDFVAAFITSSPFEFFDELSVLIFFIGFSKPKGIWLCHTGTVLRRNMPVNRLCDFPPPASLCVSWLHLCIVSKLNSLLQYG